MSSLDDAMITDDDARRRSALLEAAEALAHIGSWEWTPVEADLLWSDNLFRIFGLDRDELSPSLELIFSLAHPDDVDHIRLAVDELREHGDMPPLEYRIVLPDLGVRHLRATRAVAEWRDGRPHRIIGWVQDITEQRRAEREIAAHYAVAHALNDWDGFETGAERLLARLAAAMDFVAGVFWVPDDGRLVARVLWSAPSAHLPGFVAQTRRARLAHGRELPGAVWSAREPISLRSVADAPDGDRQRAAIREGLRGAVAIPAVSRDEVLAVIELVAREEAQLTERLMRSLTGIGYELGHFLARRRGQLEAPLLTAREREVLQLAAQGLSAPQTAERLFVSETTIRTHLQNLYPKLGVADKASAVATALRQGLID